MLKPIDAAQIPDVGRGQQELIIGDRRASKTAIACHDASSPSVGVL